MPGSFIRPRNPETMGNSQMYMQFHADTVFACRAACITALKMSKIFEVVLVSFRADIMNGRPEIAERVAARLGARLGINKHKHRVLDDPLWVHVGAGFPTVQLDCSSTSIYFCSTILLRLWLFPTQLFPKSGSDKVWFCCSGPGGQCESVATALL